MKDKKGGFKLEKISKIKRDFLFNIGVDLRNLPHEFSKINENIENFLDNDMIELLEDTNKYNKKFYFKDIVGRVNTNYKNDENDENRENKDNNDNKDNNEKNINCTWIEYFMSNKEIEKILEKYNNNSKELEDFDKFIEFINKIDEQDEQIELYEQNGQLFVKTGKDKITIMMMRYLLECSKAISENEKREIDAKYSLYGNVRTLPYKKSIIYMTGIIRDNIKTSIINKSKDEYDINYTIKIKENSCDNINCEKVIKNKGELEKYIKNSYEINNCKSFDEVTEKIEKLLKDYRYAKKNSLGRQNVYKEIFIGINKFEEEYEKMRKFNLEQTVYKEFDLDNITIERIFNKVNNMEKEEEEEQKIKEIEEKETIEETIEETDKTTEDKIENEIENKKENKIESKAENKKVNRKINKKEEIVAELTKELEVKEFKERIAKIVEELPLELKDTTNEMENEKNKYEGLSKRLGIAFSDGKIDFTSQADLVNSLDMYLQEINGLMYPEKDLDLLFNVKLELTKIKEQISTQEVKASYNEEVRKEFEEGFRKRTQELIKDADLERLLRQKEEKENEKINFLEKIIGKKKLRDEELKSIEIKLELLKSKQNKPIDEYTLEESIADLYMECKNEGKETEAVKEFLNNAKKENEIENMMDKKQLDRMINYKEGKRPITSQIATLDGKGKINYRKQAEILEKQNIEKMKEIRNMRMSNLIAQNKADDEQTVKQSNYESHEEFYNSILEMRDNAKKLRESMKEN